MKKINALITKMCFIALCALPIIISSCNDDDDKYYYPTNFENLSLPNDTIIAKGEDLTLKPTLNLINPKIYSWKIDGKEVSNEVNYTFSTSVGGKHEIIFEAQDSKGNTDKAQITVDVFAYYGGFYVINEGWAGHDPASVNYYKDGKWNFNIVESLGQTGTVGVIQDSYMYIVAKNAPYLTQIELANFNITKQLSTEIEEQLDYGQANSFCTINETTGILTASRGAYKINLNPLSIGNMLPQLNSESANGNGCKDILKSGDYVFVNNMDTIKIYKASDLSFVKKLTALMKTGFAQTKDGNIWAANGQSLIKINPKTLDEATVELPDNINVFYNQWAYTPTGLCASTTENALYIVNTTVVPGAYGDSYYGKNIYKYNTESKIAQEFFKAPSKIQSIYGAGIQVNPQNGDVYLIYTEDGYGAHYLNTNIYVADGQSGTQKQIIDYTGKYWFPSSIVFK